MTPDKNISRRKFLETSTTASLVTGLHAPLSKFMPFSPPKASQHNIIIFMPDQLRAESIGCYGHPLVKTPNIDTLAVQGTRFTHCQSAYPVCTAARCSMMTGWPPHVRGHRSIYYLLQPDEPNLFRYLKNNGYDVYWYGKNDLLVHEIFEPLEMFPKEHIYYPKIWLENTYPEMISRTTTIRSKNYKLTLRPQSQSEFYDLTNDPGELYNLYDDPAYEKQQTALKIKLLDWYIRTSDVVPVGRDQRGMPRFTSEKG